MAAGGKRGGMKRLRQELERFHKEPPDYIQVAVNEKNIFEWHYLLEGPKETPYDGGWYHGKLIFPPEYPFAPPGIMMHTPSGRFETNMRLCLSMSDYHPESWQPSWSVATVLQGLLSFMTGKEMTTGAIETSDEEKKALALRSMEHNLRNPVFIRMFPDAEERAKARKLGIALPAKGSATLATDEDNEEEGGGSDETTRKDEGGEQVEKRASEETGSSLDCDGEIHNSIEKMQIKQEVSARNVQDEQGGAGEKKTETSEDGEGEVLCGGIEKGATVFITGLVKQAHLNGIRCRVEGGGSGGRLRVRMMEPPGKEILLNLTNIEVE